MQLYHIYIYINAPGFNVSNITTDWDLFQYKTGIILHVFRLFEQNNQLNEINT